MFGVRRLIKLTELNEARWLWLNEAQWLWLMKPGDLGLWRLVAYSHSMHKAWSMTLSNFAVVQLHWLQYFFSCHHIALSPKDAGMLLWHSLLYHVESPYHCFAGNDSFVWWQWTQWYNKNKGGLSSGWVYPVCQGQTRHGCGGLMIYCLLAKVEKVEILQGC